ncbi:MAG: hypothetical protein IJW26_04415 [Clostridia bacterium]|nr:hypothetical protein [Clostridia bacterium]
MEKSKVLTFIGFSLRAKQLRCGVNAIQTIKKNVKVLILCATASNNTFDEVVKIAKRLNSTLIISVDNKVEDIVNKSHCKLLAVENDSLAQAILDNLDSHFVKYSGGYGINYGRKQ